MALQAVDMHWLFMQVSFEPQVIGQVRVWPQPSDLVPHSEEPQLAVGMHAHWPLLSQLPLMQSPSMLQVLPAAHPGQLPPQSTSVSSWFFFMSVQLGSAHRKPLPQKPDSQSLSTTQPWPVAHGPQSGPPQSVPVSVPFFFLSEQPLPPPSLLAWVPASLWVPASEPPAPLPAALPDLPPVPLPALPPMPPAPPWPPAAALPASLTLFLAPPSLLLSSDWLAWTLAGAVAPAAHAAHSSSGPPSQIKRANEPTCGRSIARLRRVRSFRRRPQAFGEGM